MRKLFGLLGLIIFPSLGWGSSLIINAASGSGSGTITQVTAGQGLTGGGTSGNVTVSVSSVSLSTQVIGNLPVTNLNSGTGATSSTFFRGDGTWAAPAGGSGGGNTQAANQFSAPYYNVAGSSTSLAAFPGVTLSTNTGVIISTLTIINPGQAVLITSNTILQGSTFYADGTTYINYLASATIGNLNLGIPGQSYPTILTVAEGLLGTVSSGLVHRVGITTMSSGQLPIGRTVGGGFTLASITGTANQLNVTNGDGAITLNTGSNVGLLITTQTWSGQNNWTTPLPSTFTYGLTVGSETVNGPGNGAITFTINGSTYSVTSSSVVPIVGDYIRWSSTNATFMDGGNTATPPSAPNFGVQIDSNGIFGASTNFTYNGSSLTVQNSSVTITSNGTQNNITGFVDIYDGAAYSNKPLFSVGSQTQNQQFYIPNAQPVNMTTYGAWIGGMKIGLNGAQSQQLLSQSRNNYVEVNKASTMTFNTDNDIGGGDMVFQPQNTEALRISKITGVTVTANLNVVNTSTPGIVQLYELQTNGTNYVGIIAAPSFGSTYAVQLPTTAPPSGDAMVFTTPAVNSFGVNTATGTWVSVPGTGACPGGQFETGDNQNAAPTCGSPSGSGVPSVNSSGNAAITSAVTLACAGTASCSQSGSTITITASAGAGGASSLAVGVGSSAGYSTLVSSPSNGINFSSSAYLVTLEGPATAYVQPLFTRCSTIENLVAADSGTVMGIWPVGITIEQIGCTCNGVCTTPAAFGLEDGNGTAMTLSQPTCGTILSASNSYAATAFTTVTAANHLNTGDPLRLTITNTPAPTTDIYTLCIQGLSD